MPPPFNRVIELLKKHYGTPAPRLTDPLQLIIWENIGYLVDDDKRAAAFERLRREVGLKPTDILSAPTEKLVEITKLGGVHPELRAQRLKEIAHIVLNDFDGNLLNVLKLPLPKAIKALKKFHQSESLARRRSYCSARLIQSLRLNRTGCAYCYGLALARSKRAILRAIARSVRRWQASQVTVISLFPLISYCDCTAKLFVKPILRAVRLVL